MCEVERTSGQTAMSGWMLLIPRKIRPPVPVKHNRPEPLGGTLTTDFRWGSRGFLWDDGITGK